MLKGIDYLREKLRRKKYRVRTRYRYYEQKNRARDWGISTPPDLKYWMSTLGWCAKGVDELADRLQFKNFKNDPLSMTAVYDQNNKKILTDSAILSALIGSCSFVYITTEAGKPKLKIIDAAHATGEIDPSTMMLKEGYAVLDYDKQDNPIMEAYLIPGMTYIYENGELVQSIPNISPHPLLVPIIYKPDAVRPFGHSRITRACMSISDSATRSVKRSEVASEFGSINQKWAIGLDPDNDALESWNAAMSSMLRIDKNEDGSNDVKVGQFDQLNFEPQNDQIRMFAGLFSGETGLTLDDLGFPSDNPSSAEAIKSTHESLRLAARKAQSDFETGFKNAGFVAACIRDGQAYDLAELANVKTLWAPIFEPDYSALASVGDALYKLNEMVPGFVTPEMITEMTGLESSQDQGEVVDPAALDKVINDGEVIS